MTTKRMLGAGAFALSLASVACWAESEPTASMAAKMDSMQATIEQMHSMMMSMHGQGGMMMGEMQGMSGMSGMAMGGGGGLQANCVARGPEAGLSALFLGPVSTLGLTEAQKTQFEAILARAQAEALAGLTAEQRTRMEAAPPVMPGVCGAPQAATPSH